MHQQSAPAEQINRDYCMALQSGNSGGPLIIMDGELVGIVTSKLSATKVFRWTGDLPQNVNYAMKSRFLLHLLEQAVDTDLVLDEVPAGSGLTAKPCRRFQGLGNDSGGALNLLKIGQIA